MPTLFPNDIQFPPLNQSVLPNQHIATEGNCLSVQLNFTPAGGSFSITILRNTAILPLEDINIQLPLGRFGVVKSVTRGQSSGGLVDVISGPALPIQLTQVNFVGYAANAAAPASTIATILSQLGSVAWKAFDPTVKAFTYRGISLAGIQQLASLILADVFINRGQIYVLAPGQLPGEGLPVFVAPTSDIVALSQNSDYSLDIRSVLNPALTAVNVDDPGNFIYDGQHAIKQANTTVQCGAPGGTGAQDFIPIPDGWMIDGNFEEWTPSGTDLTNPNASVARYWKTFPSPTQPGVMRGITNFTRLVRDLKLPGNVSSFVGSPITALTQGSGGGPNSFILGEKNTESGIFGFTADDTAISDVVSGQYLSLTTALQLTVPGGNSGNADSNFYSVQLGLWTFPRVLPTVFPIGNPTNPFGLPNNVIIINPSSNVATGGSTTYWLEYVKNFKLINSPRLKTQVTVVYRGILPQPGDMLVVQAADLPTCGRIDNVSLNLQRGGITLTITAQVYQFQTGISGGPEFSG